VTEITDRQQKILGAIEVRSSKVAGMYETALSSLRSKVEANREVARVVIICHSMREVMLGLPDALDVDSEERPSPSASALTLRLPDLLREHSQLNLGAEQDNIPVPRSVAQVFNELIKTVTQEQGRNLRNNAALITKGTDTKHPALREWSTTYRFFVKWAHLDRISEGERALPSQDELLAHIKVVEDVIDVGTSVFFDNVHAVADLLAKINEQFEEPL
jgi:hypothetical protein